MRVAVTGTPGTGKTTATSHLETDLEVVHLNEVIQRESLTQGVDEQRDSAIADLDAVRSHFEGRDNAIFESHLAHHLPVDIVIILRCHPETIEQRLLDRGESPESASENAESEALDGILSEAVQMHGAEHIYEIETTDRSPETVADEIQAVIDGDRDPQIGIVSYTSYL